MIPRWLSSLIGRFRRKPHSIADRRPCAGCGRIVAHTKRGTAYVHRCRAELLKEAR